MARTNGPIQVWNSNDSTPTDSQGGYAGGDSTAAALATFAGTVDSVKSQSLARDFGTGDLNDVTYTSVLRVWNFNANTNRPPGESSGIMYTVFNDQGTQGIQTWYTFGSVPKAFQRFRGSTSWTAWVQTDASIAAPAAYAVPTNSITGGVDDTDTWQTTGPRIAWASHNVANTPGAGKNWRIDVTRQGSTSILQVATSIGITQEQYQRWRGSTGWTAWTRMDVAGVDSTIDTKVTAKVAGINPAIVGAPMWRTLPLPLTAGGGGATWSTTSGGLRHRFRVPAEVVRWRVHVRDINPRFGLIQNTDLTVAGVWVGPQGATPGRWDTAPTWVSSGGSVTGGADWVSKWITTPITADTWHTLGISWSASAAPQAVRTTAWTTAQADTNTPAAATTQTTSPPFDVWLECEVPASMPAVAVISDSLGVGVGSTYGMSDAWGAQLAQTQKWWPILMGHSGDAIANWTDPNAYKWNRFPGTSKPDSVALVIASNDIFSGATLATLQANAQTVANNARDKLANAVYATTILPRENVSGAIEDTRRAYNTWLKTLPFGARDIIDIVPAVSTDDETLRDEYDADGTHLNTAGYAAIAAAFTRPLAPKRPGSSIGLALTDAPTTAAARAAIGAAEDYDTGWREIKDVAGTFLNGWTATSVKIRRQGDRVTLRVAGLSSASATADDWLLVPTGFRNPNVTFPMLVGLTVVPVRTNGGGTLISSRPVNADVSGRAAEVSWLCDQARPTTLPGVAA